MKVYTPLEKSLGDWIDGSERVSWLDEADIVLLPGGSDVNPALYGHEKLLGTHVNGNADFDELALIEAAMGADKFIVGICKGAQMLTMVAGGWLIQDVDGHHGYHEIETADGKKFTVNSSHHQMCFPYDLPDEDYEVLGWSGESSTYTVEGNQQLVEYASGILSNMKANTNIGRFKEPEVIWYPKIRGLAIQSHPEWSSMPADFNKWANELILKLI